MPDRRRSAVRNAIYFHIAASLLAGTLVGSAAVAISARVAADDARHDAENATRAVARIICPQVDTALRAHKPQSIATMHDLISRRVLDDSIVRVKIWDGDGTVLYSDAADLIGQRYPLDEADLNALRTRTATSDVSDLSRPENVDERSLGPLVEVYYGAQDASGVPVLFEAYFSLEELRTRQTQTERTLAVLVGIALLVMELLLIPLALLLARRVERFQRERLNLVRAAADASASERRRVAAQLHDGVIQSLSGAGYALTAVSSQLARNHLPEVEHRVRSVQEIVRSDVESLRAMISTLYAADLSGMDLAEALAEAAGDLSARGVEVDLELDDTSLLPTDVVAATYKVAREAMRNSARHSGSERIGLRLAVTKDLLRLRVMDHGEGFDPSRVPEVGHIGLALMRDCAASVEGHLEVESSPGAGTVVQLDVPIRDAGIEP